MAAGTKPARRSPKSSEGVGAASSRATRPLLSTSTSARLTSPGVIGPFITLIANLGCIKIGAADACALRTTNQSVAKRCSPRLGRLNPRGNVACDAISEIGAARLPLQRGWGGLRAGAGRKMKVPGRKNVAHRARERRRAHPVHVVLRSRVRSLRSRFLFPTLRRALARANRAHGPARFASGRPLR
jgi:hypothetical protein